MRFLAWAIIVVLIAATVLIARGAEMPAVMLVDHVAVNHVRITLADLLPGAASPTLQVRAAQFDLGRAPQVGAARVLEREWLQARLSESEFSVLALPPRIVVERTSRNDAARERVKAAVRNYLNAKIGSRAAGSADFGWPGNVPHLKPDASLNVVSDEWDKRTHTLQLRIACSARRDCLPFYLTLRFAGSPAELGQIAGKFAHPRESASPAPREDLERTASVSRLPLRKPAPVLTQPGTLASMTVETRGIHIFTQVMCLERGVEGQIIRVRNPDSKRILRPQVVGPGRVRGPV